MKRLSWLLLLGVVLTIPGGLAAQDSPTAKPKPARRNPDLITQEEIQNQAPDAQNAHDIVSRLRPIWLSTRGVASMTMGAIQVQVYVNDVHRGGPSTLSDIARGEIAEIRHLRGTDATQRFGTDHENGAILVKLK